MTTNITHPEEDTATTNQNNTSSRKKIQSHSTETDSLLENIDCLARSQSRLQILNNIEREACSLSDLQRRLDIHRTTLRRNIKLLKEKQWIRTEPGENLHHITPAGRIFIEAFHKLFEKTNMAADIGSFLSEFPEPSPVNTKCLRGCNVTVPNTYDPDLPANRISELLADSARISLCAPSVLPRHLQIIADRVSDGVCVELVSTRSLFERMEVNDITVFETLVEADSAELFVSTGLPRFGVGMVDKSAFIVDYDDNMKVHSVLETAGHQDDLIQWVKDRYRENKQTAQAANLSSVR